MSEEKPKPNTQELSKWPPGWAWVFIIACVAIPVITLGGAIPMGIGAGGAAGVYSIARDESRSTQSRVIISAVIAVIAWAIFLAFIAFIVPSLLDNGLFSS